jgi:type IV pilus assembly protein PilV
MNNKRWMERKCFSVQQGFTLLEVLIALVVLSIGLLGLAFLQINALQSSLFSYQTTVANMIAKDAKERLWIELALPRSNEPDERFVCGSVAFVDVEGDVRADWSVGEDAARIPGLNVSITAVEVEPCGFLVEVFWIDTRMSLGDGDESDVSMLNYYVKLPGLWE